MTENEKLAYVCRRCAHCYERHTSPRIERSRWAEKRPKWVCMVRAKAMSDNLDSDYPNIAPCATHDRRGHLHLTDFEMREDG